MKSFFIACLAATSTFAAPLAAPQFGGFPSFGGGLGGSTKNDVINGVCKPVTYIFARGTTEIGNMGSTVGPALEKALESAFGQNNVATQGVTYPADVAGAISGALSPGTAQGARTMASLTQQVLSKCPDTKVILAGYSQGAEQVHGALINLQNGQVAVRLDLLCVKLDRLLTNCSRLLLLLATRFREAPSEISTPVVPRCTAISWMPSAMVLLLSLLLICPTPFRMLPLPHSLRRVSLGTSKREGLCWRCSTSLNAIQLRFSNPLFHRILIVSTVDIIKS
jgi:cutinase